MKLLYLAKRNPAFTPEAFPPRWRQHGALAMGFPDWDRNAFYTQADRVRPDPVPGLSAEYDGVAYVFLGETDLENPSPEQARKSEILQADELVAFDGPVMPRAMIVAEDVVKAGPRGGFTGFFFFRDEEAARSLAKAAAASPATARAIVNAVQATAAPDSPLDYRAVVEIAAGDLAGLTAALDAPEVAAARKMADLSLATLENVLWDRL